MEEVSKSPNLMATTGNAYCCTIGESRIRNTITAPTEASNNLDKANTPIADEDQEYNYFKLTQWTPDGTTLLTSTADNSIRTFILPADVLSSPFPITLTPYTTHTHPSPINCLAPYPLYDLREPTTTLYLTTPSNLPIRLLNTLDPTGKPLSAYSLIHTTTETYLTPASILWSEPNHFITGTDCLIAYFDASRDGEGPVIRMPTIPSKRHLMKGGGVGIRGIVSALGQQPTAGESDAGTGLLAAGTWTRSVGLYDVGGLGGTVSIFSVAKAADEISGIGGTGISQTVWSPCGRYLCVVERKSKGVLVYDVRVAGKLVCWLEGREADTNQRLSIDVFQGADGMEVWGGGTDGVVRVWENVGMSEGKQENSWEWTAHDDPVGSTALHPSGSVVATCSGQRRQLNLEGGSDSDSSSESISDSSDDESDDNIDNNSDMCDVSGDSSRSSINKPQARTPDNTMKVWSI